MGAFSVPNVTTKSDRRVDHFLAERFCQILLSAIPSGVTGVSAFSSRVAHVGVTDCGHIDLGLYLITILKFDRLIFLKDFVTDARLRT